MLDEIFCHGSALSTRTHDCYLIFPSLIGFAMLLSLILHYGKLISFILLFQLIILFIIL